MIELALRGGGPDNITCIVADVVDIDFGDDAPIIGGSVGDGSDDGPRPGLGRRPRLGHHDDPRTAPQSSRCPPPRRRSGGHALRIGVAVLAVLIVLGRGAWPGPAVGAAAVLRRRRRRPGRDLPGRPRRGARACRCTHARRADRHRARRPARDRAQPGPRRHHLHRRASTAPVGLVDRLHDRMLRPARSSRPPPTTAPAAPAAPAAAPAAPPAAPAPARAPPPPVDTTPLPPAQATPGLTCRPVS